MDGQISGPKGVRYAFSPLKILHVTAYARSGGASVAACRLCAAQAEMGVNVRLLVQYPEDVRAPWVVATRDVLKPLRPMLDRLPTLAWRNRRTPHWSNAWLSNAATRQTIAMLSPDILHLHWINHGMLSISDIGLLTRPVVWTFHDSWPLTGGCHVPFDCENFRNLCGFCPELRSRREVDSSRRNMWRKREAWSTANFFIVVPSRWLADRAKTSPLFRHASVTVIPNAIDLKVFRPENRRLMRQRLGWPEHVRVVLLVAHGAHTDPNKGYDLWLGAQECLRQQRLSIWPVEVGTGPSRRASAMAIGATYRRLAPAELAAAMAGADVVVVPSRLENYPNVIAESLACGTPVVAFRVGGIPEMILHGETGYLARPYDVQDLAQGIRWLVGTDDRIRQRCANFAQRMFAPDIVAIQHLELYENILKRE